MRADTTLIGFDQNDWQRGNRSYVFKGGGTVMCYKIVVVDNNTFTSNLTLIDAFRKRTDEITHDRQ